jgi:hypothetical protein
MISKESAEAFVSGIEAMLVENGLDHPFELGESLFQWLSQAQEDLVVIRSREAFSQFVQTWEADAEANLPIVLGLFQMVPEIVRKEVARMIQKAIRKNLIEIPPGRPKTVEDSIKRQICDSVIDLYRKGVPVSSAQERIAARHEISLRSVQRIWRQRHTLEEAKPESIRDIIAAIEKI